MILKKHDEIDWRQLLSHMELYWEVLLMALLNFRFVYPERAPPHPELDDGRAARAAARPV